MPQNQNGPTKPRSPTNRSRSSTSEGSETKRNAAAAVVAAPVSPTAPVKELVEVAINTQSRYKTEICRQWVDTGVCRYTNKCQFAHGEHELRPVLRHPRFKTELCRSYHQKGTCPYGNRCRFIHDQHDAEVQANSVLVNEEILEPLVAAGQVDSASLAALATSCMSKLPLPPASRLSATLQSAGSNNVTSPRGQSQLGTWRLAPLSGPLDVPVDNSPRDGVDDVENFELETEDLKELEDMCQELSELLDDRPDLKNTALDYKFVDDVDENSLTYSHEDGSDSASQNIWGSISASVSSSIIGTN